MKNIKGLFGLLLAFTLGTLAFSFTGNFIAGFAAASLTMHAYVYITGFQYDSSMFVLSTLVSIPASAPGKGNPGGGRKLYLAPVETITGIYPVESNIVNGELIAGPAFETGEAFVEVAISDKSLKIDQQQTGTVGYQSYQHMLEVKIAGYGKEQVNAISKLLNRSVVAMVVLNDGQRVLLGTNYLGLDLEIVHTTEAGGAGRREWTIKGQQTGYMHGYLPIADSAIVPIDGVITAYIPPTLPQG
jgi:hypothetical protein